VAGGINHSLEAGHGGRNPGGKESEGSEVTAGADAGIEIIKAEFAV